MPTVGKLRLSQLTLGFSGRLLVITALICFLIWFGRLVMNPLSCHISGPREWLSSIDGMRNYAIRTTWDGGCVNHEPVKIFLGTSPDGNLRMDVLAPFFNSPEAPDGKSGQPFDKLWDYEVVEAFFLNDKNQYLEVELSPHGHHLLLMLNGVRKMVKDKLQLTFTSTIEDGRWMGQAVIPRSYLPPGVTKFNAYAIHGEGNGRTYEALYPAVGDFDTPDFHRLEFFKILNLKEVLPEYDPKEVSALWSPYNEH